MPTVALDAIVAFAAGLYFQLSLIFSYPHFLRYSIVRAFLLEEQKIVSRVLKAKKAGKL